MTAPLSCYRDMLYELRGSPGNVSMPEMFNGLRFLKQSSDRIYNKLRIRFQPFYETQVLDPSSWIIDSETLQLTTSESFFSVSEVKNGDGLVLDSSLYSIPPWQRQPYKIIKLASRTSWYRTVCAPYLGASQAAITAVWGWHADYQNAWADSMDTVQDNPLLVGSATMNVEQASGQDIYDRFPRFSPGQLLRLGSGSTLEIVELTVVNGDVLTILRGQNGTTAVQHELGESIAVWDAPWDVQQAAVRFACYPYKRRGDYAKGNFDMAAGIAISLPADLPGEVCGILQDYVNGVY